MKARLDHGWIAAHLPHQGRMCLLDEVLSWDAQQLLCRADSHRAADHPLRAHGRLGSACAIEYAAQAAALHGSLLQLPPASPLPAASPLPSAAGLHLLASVRAFELNVERLDDIAGDLLIGAARLQAGARGALYRFVLDEAAAAGRAPRRLAQGNLGLWLGPSGSGHGDP
ncbi:MAG TPA: hypothetical protein VHX52_04860 [Steroidobacteraceae bacterium]|jgi:predicted hotdog family 3-hydroxylacyl-ACP dehydratase|nr:hypothetical protein [Steroidobacteraceae bacterium]